MSYVLHGSYESFFSDTLTPVGVYLNIRDLGVGSMFFEGKHSENKKPITCIGFKPIAECHSKPFSITGNLPEILQNGLPAFSYEHNGTTQTLVYEYVVVFDHENHRVYSCHFKLENSQNACSLKEISQRIQRQDFPKYPFTLNKNTHQFTGDVFNLFRSFRALHPSPTRFYIDKGGKQWFGSEPSVSGFRIPPVKATSKFSITAQNYKLSFHEAPLKPITEQALSELFQEAESW